MRFKPSKLCVRMEPFLWRQLGLDDPDTYNIVRSALYLGYGVESLKRISKLPRDSVEVTEVLRVAPLLGMTAEDVITKKG